MLARVLFSGLSSSRSYWHPCEVVVSSLSPFPRVPAELAVPGVSLQPPGDVCWPSPRCCSSSSSPFATVEQLFCDSALRNMYFQICSGCLLSSICDEFQLLPLESFLLLLYFHCQRMVGIVGIGQCCKRPTEYGVSARSVVFGQHLFFSKAFEFVCSQEQPLGS